MTGRGTGNGVPGWAVVIACLGGLFVVLPLAGVLANVDWADLGTLLLAPSSLAALRLSLVTAVSATVLCLLLGVPMALVLARLPFRGRALARALVLLPLVLPPVVGGIALLYTYGRRGLVGPGLELAGIHLAFSTIAVVLAQTFVALPFLVLSVEGAVRTAGTAYESVAATLGASPTRTLLRVTLPLLRPAVVSGAILAFARALGEFGATITFAGSLPGVTQTLPLEVYFQLNTRPAAAVALSLLLVAVSIGVVAVAYGRTTARGTA